MSKQQQEMLDAILRQGQFDTGADVETLRKAFGELMAQVPVARIARGPPPQRRVPARRTGGHLRCPGHARSVDRPSAI